MPGQITLARDGPVATVTLDNPSKLNALTVAMWKDLARVMRVEFGRIVERDRGDGAVTG